MSNTKQYTFNNGLTLSIYKCPEFNRLEVAVFDEQHNWITEQFTTECYDGQIAVLSSEQVMKLAVDVLSA